MRSAPNRYRAPASIFDELCTCNQGPQITEPRRAICVGEDGVRAAHMPETVGYSAALATVAR